LINEERMVIDVLFIVTDLEDEEAKHSTESMVVDSEAPNRISTHGPRHSRREEWRRSKGMVARPNREVMNRQGGLAARRKAGKPKRRR